jgi:hypothetical protein
MNARSALAKWLSVALVIVAASLILGTVLGQPVPLNCVEPGDCRADALTSQSVPGHSGVTIDPPAPLLEILRSAVSCDVVEQATRERVVRLGDDYPPDLVVVW